eukprot:scaffold27.g5993.t1
MDPAPAAKFGRSFSRKGRFGSQECVKQYWKPSFRWRYVTGDQANLTTLEFMAGNGGHTNPQIWNSFQVLFFKALKPGGVYFVEVIIGGLDREWICSMCGCRGGSGCQDGSGIDSCSLIVASQDIHVGRHPGWYAGGIPGGNGSVVVDALLEWADQLVTKSAGQNGNKTVVRQYQHKLPAEVVRVDCIGDMCAVTKAAT